MFVVRTFYFIQQVYEQKITRIRKKKSYIVFLLKIY